MPHPSHVLPSRLPIRPTTIVLGVAALVLTSACTTAPTAPAALPRLAAASPAPLPVACDALARQLPSLPGTRIMAVATVPAGTVKVGGKNVAEHCLVSGAMNERTGALDNVPYAIGFELRLPKDWNGRFWYQANGGIDGAVVPATGEYGGGALTSALAQGFAVVSSDAGHSNRLTRGPGFGIDPQARLDYGYATVGTLTPVAKALVAAAYGKAPERSYIGGCSNGGRHAMVAATRFPEMFDGYLVGAPGYRLPLAAVANIFGAQRYAKVATDPKALSSAFTDTERATVVRAVLDKCDALDGLKDGMIQNAAACQARFDFKRDVPTCAGARDGSCLSAAQKEAIAPIFSGATTADGKPFYAPFPIDAGLAGAGVKQWEFDAPLTRDSGAVGLIWAVPPNDPKTFDGPKYILNTPIEQLLAAVHAKNATYQESAMEFMTPVQPTRLEKLRDRGAKMLVYHGNSDAIFSAEDTEAWYTGLQKVNGGRADGFARYYRVPGMDHCRGGPATDQFDVITPLVRWVEQGQAPEAIVAQVRGPGNAGGDNKELPAGWSATRTRPLCPSPKVATYNGSGDPESAASFTCR